MTSNFHLPHHIHLSFLEIETEDDDHYNGVDEVELTESAGEKNDSRGTENPPNERNAQNPYYEGDFDLCAQGNDRSRTDIVNPDLNDTQIITSTQNVYYEL